jgi:adenylate cyclase
VLRDRWSTRVTAIGVAVVLIAGAVGAALYFHLGRAPVPLPDQLAKPSERFSMVVLPFANPSGDASQDYLADIISDELTTGFSRFRNSFVISRSTAFTYKGKPINVRQIGKDLGVRYALEGSVQLSGDRLRVNAQLIDTESDAHLWADRFDENRSDLLQMQDAIVHRIAFAIGIKLIDERARAREAQTRAANPNAEDLAFRCSAVLMRTIWASERDSAFRLCEQALEIDPENVRALSHLSSKFTQRFFHLASPDPQADFRRADELASLAVKIDPGYHMAHTAKGDALLAAGRYRDAIDSYGRALMLAPNTILLGLPQAYNFVGEPEQAIAYADKAMRLSPHIPGRVGPIFYLAKAITFGILQEHEQALVWIERAEAAAPEMLVMGFFRSVLLAIAGQEAEARAAMQRYLANDNAPIRTMSQWHARQSGKPLPSYSPRFLIWGKQFAQHEEDRRLGWRWRPHGRQSPRSIPAYLAAIVSGDFPALDAGGSFVGDPLIGLRAICHYCGLIKCPLLACAVQGGDFQWVQTRPGNRSQPEAIGAVVEVTKWLKPSISVSRIGDSASVQAANASERRASSEKDDV